MTVPKLIIITSHIPILFAAAYALYLYKELGRELKAFAWFIFFSAIVQGVSLWCWFLKINNMPLLHLYAAAGFVLLARFYTALFYKFVRTRIIWLTAACFLLFSLVNLLFFQGIYTFCSNTLTVESVLIIILSVFTFSFFLKRIVKTPLWSDSKSFNWINAGLFIYYSSTLLISFFGAYIVHRLSETFSLYTWQLHSFFSVVMYTCFIIGLWNRSKNPAF